MFNRTNHIEEDVDTSLITQKAATLSKVNKKRLSFLGRGGADHIEIPESPLYTKGSYIVTNEDNFSVFAKAKAAYDTAHGLSSVNISPKAVGHNMNQIGG